MAAKLNRLTHKIAVQLHLLVDMYHLRISRQAASTETFGTPSYLIFRVTGHYG